jgi:hypothetical protein
MARTAVADARQRWLPQMRRTRGNCGSSQDEMAAANVRKVTDKTDKCCSGSSIQEERARVDVGCGEQQEREAP